MPSVGFIEKARAPKIMSIGFHLRMIGQPGRIAALHKILGHIADRGNVRNCATDRHHQPLARTVPRELLFKAYAPIEWRPCGELPPKASTTGSLAPRD
jgi:hypothetical protein